MVSIDDLYKVVHGLFKEPIIGRLKSKMAEIRHLEDGHDVIFLPWIKFRRLVQNHVDCGDMVEIQTGSRILIWRMFGGIHCHVIPEPRAIFQGERITSAILKIVFRRIFFFCFSNAVWASTSGGFRIVFDTLVLRVMQKHIFRNTVYMNRLFQSRTFTGLLYILTAEYGHDSGVTLRFQLNMR